jgi:predicted ATPase/class 3 adenylate cyclase
MAELPTGIVTLLFSDIEGSTRLLEVLGRERYAEVLARHRNILRSAFAAHGGYEVDYEGDAFFVSFPSAIAAVAAAVMAQRSLAAEEWPDGYQLRVRIGLHTGEPLAVPPKYVGLDIHRAARIMAAGHGGQVLLSERTASLVEKQLPEGVSIRDLGEHRLKDLQEPVWIYQLGEASFPPLRSLSNTNLPIPASSFLGREAELAEAEALLFKSRLLTVSGPGGAGKTRFAIELASRQLSEFPNGVFWVPLVALRDPSMVLEEAARVLGAKDTLPAHVADKKMLLLLDNFEQVVEAAPGVTELLRNCPNLRVLVTSRETLRVGGETEYELPPLVEHEGLALFSARARVEPGRAVRELCLHLDGLPLAIELAAARVKVLSPEKLLPRLSERLDLLKGGRDAESRHATLRATIAWSYELLSPEERRLFARLAVFAGGCTLDAAEEVCGANIDTLQSLLDKSLLRRTDGRYWMLETIREYALERLAEQVDEAATVGRHTDYFLRFAEEAYPHLEGADQRVWMSRLDPEHDNLRAALAHAREAGDGEVELRLALAIAPFRVRRGYLSEGLLSLEHALAVSRHGQLRAQALHYAGWTAAIQGQNDKAEALLAEGLAVARQFDDHKRTARLLLTFAGIVSDRDEDEAQALYDELVSFMAEHPDERFPAAFLNLADFALRRGDYESARDFSTRSIALLREEGDPWSLALSIANHGLALLGLHQDEKALEELREALRLQESLEDTHGIATILSALAATFAARGEFERATRLLASAEHMLEDTESKLTGFEATLHDRTLERARAECDDFDAEWVRGRAMTKDEALAEALGETAVRDAGATATFSSRRTG